MPAALEVARAGRVARFRLRGAVASGADGVLLGYDGSRISVGILAIFVLAAAHFRNRAAAMSKALAATGELADCLELHRDATPHSQLAVGGSSVLNSTSIRVGLIDADAVLSLYL